MLFKRMGRDGWLAVRCGLSPFARCRAVYGAGQWIARSVNTGSILGALAPRTEGTIWCRGWGGEAVRALRAAAVME